MAKNRPRSIPTLADELEAMRLGFRELLVAMEMLALARKSSGEFSSVDRRIRRAHRATQRQALALAAELHGKGVDSIELNRIMGEARAEAARRVAS